VNSPQTMSSSASVARRPRTTWRWRARPRRHRSLASAPVPSHQLRKGPPRLGQERGEGPCSTTTGNEAVRQRQPKLTRVSFSAAADTSNAGSPTRQNASTCATPIANFRTGELGPNGSQNAAIVFGGACNRDHRDQGRLSPGGEGRLRALLGVVEGRIPLRGERRCVTACCELPCSPHLASCL
jgi:hypothetical protein